MQETALDLRYNIAAMCIAILRDDVATPEQAFAMIQGRKVRRVDYQDVEDMINLKKQGLSYTQIGEIYGISKDTAYARIKRYKKRTSSSGNLKRSTSKNNCYPNYNTLGIRKSTEG